MRQTESDDRRMDLSALPEANPDPVFVFKKNASLVYANPAGLSILDGRSIGDALGAKASTWLAEAVRYPGLCEVEFEHAGRTLQLKARAVPKQDVTMVSAHEVTALRRTQRELQVALRSSRPYKPAWAHAEARTWIVKERERHFDPAVGDAFVAVEQQFRTISESIRDGDMGEIKGTGYCSAKA